MEGTPPGHSGHQGPLTQCLSLVCGFCSHHVHWHQAGRGTGQGKTRVGIFLWVRPGKLKNGIGSCKPALAWLRLMLPLAAEATCLPGLWPVWSMTWPIVVASLGAPVMKCAEFWVACLRAVFPIAGIFSVLSYRWIAAHAHDIADPPIIGQKEVTVPRYFQNTK